jgi:hypothetical protein
LQFFQNYAAFNISLHEYPKKEIFSYVEPKGFLTKIGMENFAGSHAAEYKEYLNRLET